MSAYLFPGQGSQFKGMGKGLFDEFSELVSKANKILGYSIEELCLTDPNNNITETKYTQPALFVVNALSYLRIRNETGSNPKYVAGHSLGEYNALFAAGAFDFETGLQLVKKRGELMSKITGGAMAAVLGLNADQVQDILIQKGFSTIDIANINTPEQIVISGPKVDILAAQSIFELANAKMFIPLKVSGAFHSRYMQSVSDDFKEFIKSFQFSKMTIPVISNIYAKPYGEQELRENLVLQITNTVKWTETIQYLLNEKITELMEIGPGNVLTKMSNEIRTLYFDVKKTEEIPPASHFSASVVQDSDLLLTAETLGDEGFKQDYDLKYAYVAGSMYKGIASEEMIIQMSKAGMLGFYGSAGLSLEQIDNSIQFIQKSLPDKKNYGFNLLHYPDNAFREEQNVNLFLKRGVQLIEASAFIDITPALVLYRAKGLCKTNNKIIRKNRIIAKISRPEVAEAFLSPAPIHIVNTLLNDMKITQFEAELLRMVPVADELCVEADSGGHTDQGVAYVLMPSIIRLRDQIIDTYRYDQKIRVGAAGGIGTPEAAAAAFILGAEFIVTGSINQCTLEAKTSNAVKDILEHVNVQDTEYAPAGDMFELGARVQVLKKGLFFPSRANKLYELYNKHSSIEELNTKDRQVLEQRYFKRSLEEVYQEVKLYKTSREIEIAEQNSKYKMALIFKWYFAYSTNIALSGASDDKVNYQIHCGPSLGAFNQWVRGSNLESWRNRNVAVIGEKIMTGTADYLNNRYQSLYGL